MTKEEIELSMQAMEIDRLYKDRDAYVRCWFVFLSDFDSDDERRWELDTWIWDYIYGPIDLDAVDLEEVESIISREDCDDETECN